MIDAFVTVLLVYLSGQAWFSFLNVSLVSAQHSGGPILLSFISAGLESRQCAENVDPGPGNGSRLIGRLREGELCEARVILYEKGGGERVWGEQRPRSNTAQR